MKVAVWLHDDWARLILAAPKKGSRWVAIGVMTTAEVGLWLDSERIEERRPGGKRVVWNVTPKKLLIRWEAVITIQDMGSGEETIGFHAQE